MSTLGRVASDSDRQIADEAASEIGVLTDPQAVPAEYEPPGSPIKASTRVLLDRTIEGTRYTIFATTTTRGNVCGGLLGGAIGCIDGFRANSPVVATVLTRTGQPMVIFGYARNGVQSVQVGSDASSTAAEVQDNAFLWVGHAEPALIKELRVRIGDTETVMPLRLT